MGFTFNGLHSSSFGIKVKEVMRSLKPGRRVFRTTIGGRDGSRVFSDGACSNIVIGFDCDFIGKDMAGMRDKIAKWLSESGELALDDEPDRAYRADLFSAVPLSHMFYLSEFTLEFDCFPFAESSPRQVSADITGQGQDTVLNVCGTARAPCTIIIKNIGGTIIKDIKLVHRKERL
jgi:predicted phage tail component-like protein